MNIQFIKSNISNTSQDGLVKLLYDLIMQDINNVEDYKVNMTYEKGDRVYLEENSKHQIYQCIVDTSSTIFVRTEWQPIMEVFDGSLDKVYNLKLHEEVHIIDESTTKSITTKLEFENDKSTVAIYKGKKRYTSKYDFTINDKVISFNNPFDIGDRIILEVREKLGVPASVGVIFYDLSGVPYKVIITDDGKLSCQKIDIKQPTDIISTELVTGDSTYTMMIDSGVNPPTLGLYKDIDRHITGTDGKVYKIIVTGDNVSLIPEHGATSDIKIIMGSDRNFYTLGLVDGNVVATLVDDDSLNPNCFELGIKIITTDNKHRLIDVKNGNIRVREYTNNGGFNNIVFKSKGDGKIVYMSITEDLELEITNDYSLVSGTCSQRLDYFYFFDNNWNYYRMYFENSELYYEPCSDEMVLPDSRGINMLTPSGEITKVILPSGDGEFTINRVISVSKTGTFESPIEGFVMMVGNSKKMITVNRNADGFDIKNTDEVFRTNHHYIMSEDSKIYKLAVENNNVRFIEFNTSEFDVECIHHVGAFIKSNEMITRFDIKDGDVKFKPISTFQHRIKSDDGKSYILDIEGKPYNESVVFREIYENEFSMSVGVGELYIEDKNGEHYKANIDAYGNLHFSEVSRINTVDYEVTSLVYSKQGWYKLILDNGDLSVTKIFDNLYDNRMSYGNIVKKDFILTSKNETDYSLYANGNGELAIRKAKPLNVKGLVIRSDNGYVYGLGVKNDNLVSYESYVSNPRVPTKLYLRDTITGKIHALFMTEDRLCSEVVSTNASAKLEYNIYDVYQKEYKLMMVDNCLIIQAVETSRIDGILTEDGNEVYVVNVINNRNNIELVKADVATIIDYIDSNGTLYEVSENSEGLIDVNEVNSINSDKISGVVPVYDNTTNTSYKVTVEDGVFKFKPNDIGINKPTYVRDANNSDNLFVFRIEDGRIFADFFGVESDAMSNRPGFITVQDSTTGKSYKGFIKDQSIELKESNSIYSLEQLIDTNDGLYIIKIENGLLSFNKDDSTPEPIPLDIIDKVFKTTKITSNSDDMVVSMGGVEGVDYKEEAVEFLSNKDILDIINNLMEGE